MLHFGSKVAFSSIVMQLLLCFPSCFDIITFAQWEN